MMSKCVFSGVALTLKTSHNRIHHQGNFNERTFDNDVAILELDRSLILNERVMPACLPTRVYPANSDLYISGWGQIRGKGSSVNDVTQFWTIYDTHTHP